MITADITGAAGVREVLNGLKDSMLNKLGYEAVMTGATVLSDSAQAFARASIDTGNTFRSIGVRVKRQRKASTISGVIGPRRGFKIVDREGRTRDAAANANLIEFGHMAESGKQVAAKPFMRPALATAGGGAVSQMAGVLSRKVEQEAGKLARKAARLAKQK